MAANMPQMGGGGAVRPRPPHQQLSHLVYTQMMAQQQQPNHNGGWQDQVQANLRVSNAMNLISNSFLAMPAVDSQQLIMSGLTFERDSFLHSPDKVTYDQKIGGRVQELFKQRQAHEHSLQHSLNAQAAAQAQAQMMMNQGMMPRAMGQPAQGFQHLQQQMQPSPIPQQPHQPGMGMGGPGGLSMNPNQQGMQMRAQMPGHSAMASLSAQERAKVSQLALARLNQTAEPQRSQLRMMLQSKLTQQQLQSLQQENMDPVLFFFQNQILQAWKGQVSANAGGSQAMQMQAQQRQMNQSRQQLAGVTNGEFGPFSNVESIMNQQKAGLLAQEAGQMVVPASNGPGRNATPQPMGGVQGPNPGNHPGPNQPGIPNQLQQQFNLPQAQQLKMDQRAAQSQAQIRAQAQAKQMQGQPGGLNGPGPISQSPGMNTLNTPVRRTPMGMGQGEGQPQMGQPSGPFGQGMDPRFNQGNQQPPMGRNPNNSTQIINNIINHMSAEQRQIFMSMPAEKKNEVLMKWSNASRAGQMAGRGQPPQPSQFVQNNPMAQFGPVNNAGQQPNPNMPMAAQNQMLLQHQLNRMRNTMHNQNRPQGSPDTNAFMDSMDVPQRILEQIRANQPVPQEVKKWAQLKQYLIQKNVTQNMMQQLQGIQNTQFQTILKQRAAAGNLPQHNVPLQGPQPPNVQMPMAANPAANIGSFAGITITPQEMQSARNHERFKGLPDDKLRAALTQMKLHSLRSKANSQAPNVQMQTPHSTQPGNANIATSAPPVAAPNVLQRHQNAGLDPNPTGSVAPPRNNRQPQSNRPQPNQPTAPPQKTGLKRASTDDVVEVPNPSSTPVQRPPSQQAKASGNVPPIPQLNAAQLASLSPEQRAKIEAMIKSRQAAAAAGGAAGAVAVAQQPPMSEEMQRLKTIGHEEHINAAKESYHEIPMTTEQYQDMAQKIQSMVGEMAKISKILGRWYTLTRDDNRARMFFRMRLRLVKQYADGDKMTTLKKAFSLRPQDLDGVRAMLEGMARDVASQYPQIMKRGVNQQQISSESGPQQGTNENTATPPTGQPAPLNAANLEKQTQALNKVHQRTGSKSGQPPAAPTTAQPPFPFGAQSPNGQPTYIGKATVTQADLHLPARKKVKTGAQSGIASGGPSANSSPQVQKAPSPEMVKRQASTEVKATAPKLQFQCPEPSCEAHGIGFATDEARQNHIQEEHMKPYEDPYQFVKENLEAALGLDSNGKLKAPPNASMTAPGTSQISASMVHDVSKQGLTPTSRADATPMSREPSMKRQGSTAGSKATDLAKTIAGRINTPKPESGTKAGDNTTGSSKLDDGRPQAPPTDNAWTTMTVDPQELFRNLGVLESGGGGAISNMDVYRAITPNDTPESSKDSASSEPNSDVSEGVSLNLQLNMGLDMWNPFGGGPNVDIDSGDMELSGTGENSFQAFSWDDVQIDWNKEFQLDTSLYSMDTT
ncbi:uncharacterized protein GGS22DRAFT_80735 [Annulohypoxylon maeteangense]|uniref:uncharacterized protein n=1 Tax=Annulohypoxylon maeteangense TaxID=1927788 RepID=UPI002008647B|nr:uncharacterized protein GGS22DRAFT_80735 [Annulohypoxylon maeteangense]KAI0880826.1 hypothetical protein GGS22DRAFT_80735 [Annulohypoxylon maeteangense]